MTNHECMLQAVQHALRSVHAQRHTPTATVFILPGWTDAPYKKSHLPNQPYVQKTYELPAYLTKFRSPYQHTQPAPDANLGTKWHVGVKTIASSPFLNNIDIVEATTTMTTALRALYPTPTPHFRIDTTQRPVGSEAIKAATTGPRLPKPPPPTGTYHPQRRNSIPLTTPIPLIEPLERRHDPSRFTYTDGSRIPAATW